MIRQQETTQSLATLNLLPSNTNSYVVKHVCQGIFDAADSNLVPITPVSCHYSVIYCAQAQHAVMTDSLELVNSNLIACLSPGYAVFLDCFCYLF